MNFLHSNTLQYNDCLRLDKIDKKYYLSGDDPRKIFAEVMGRDPSQAELDLIVQNSWLPDGKPIVDTDPGQYRQWLNTYAFTFGGTAAQNAQNGGANNPYDPVAAAKAMAEETMKATEAGYAKLAAEYKARYNEYDSKNPFNFDQILAEESTKVGERLDPYYKQTLTDYLKGVNVRRQRSLEDERTLLTDLQKDTDQYVGNEKMALDQTLERTRQGYADAGLYFSGAKQRAEGMATTESKRGLGDYLRGQEGRQRDVQTTTRRNMEDIQLEQSQKQRDLGSFDPTTGNYVRGVDPTYQIKSEALGEATRRQQLRDYEKSQFLGAPPGVNYSDFTSFNNRLLGA